MSHPPLYFTPIRTRLHTMLRRNVQIWPGVLADSDFSIGGATLQIPVVPVMRTDTRRTVPVTMMDLENASQTRRLLSTSDETDTQACNHTLSFLMRTHNSAENSIAFSRSFQLLLTRLHLDCFPAWRFFLCNTHLFIIAPETKLQICVISTTCLLPEFNQPQTITLSAPRQWRLLLACTSHAVHPHYFCC